MTRFYTLLFSLLPVLLSAQATIGLLDYQPGNREGYILFTPPGYPKTYLVNKCGQLMHSWSFSSNSLTAYLAPDGFLYRVVSLGNQAFVFGGGATGRIEKVDWNNNVVWSYLISDNQQCIHHDFEVMPNGNVLLNVWMKKDSVATAAAGRDTSLSPHRFWTEQLIELQPVGQNGANIVWKWDLWDHLVQEWDPNGANYDTVSHHPELVHINYAGNFPVSEDWVHFNSIDYNPYLDQVLISSRSFNEIWIVDHSTTTNEAASHSGGNSGKGGDLLFRWGNPEMYDRGTINDKQLFGQHNARWILPSCPGAGDIMIFNNGADRPAGAFSTVDVIHPPVDSAGHYIISPNQPFGPAAPYWMYTAPIPTDFYSYIISGAQRLENGHTIMLTGTSGTFIEVDTAMQILWKYKSPVNGNGPATQGTNLFINQVFNFTFLDTNYAGFNGQTLTAGPPIELNPLPTPCSSFAGMEENGAEFDIKLYPNPAQGHLNFYATENGEACIYGLSGQALIHFTHQSPHSVVSLESLAPGAYVVDFKQGTKRILLVKN